MSAGLLESVLCKHWLHQPALDIWQDAATVAMWVRVEQALAKVQAEIGLIPKSAAIEIAAIPKDCIDWPLLRTEIAHQMHPFTPVLSQLEHLCSPEAAGYLHWGATTQNIFDTTSSLQLKQTHGLIANQLQKALASMAALASTHRLTVQAGRTHGQHALPITFGLKVAAWHAEINRHLGRIQQSAQEDLVVVMGGAVGTFSAMEGRGRAVQKRLAEVLELTDGGIPMRSSVDRFAHHVSLLALLGSSIEKIAREVVFMQRTEIAEAHESHHMGKMGSSTMAQKRNPSHALNLVGLAMRLRACSHVLQEAMVCDNEGFASHANVTDQTLAEAAVCASSLAAGLVQLIEGLSVDTVAMERNIKLTSGLIMSEALMMHLGRTIGRHKAHEVLYDVTNKVLDKGESLEGALAAHPTLKGILTTADIEKLIDPHNYLGESVQLIDAELD